MKRIILLGILIAISACSNYSPQTFTPNDVAPSPTISVNTSPNAGLNATITTVHDPGNVTGNLTGPCHTNDNGNLPDPNCTPGSIDPSITTQILCANGYTTSTYRAAESQTNHAKWDIVEPAYSQNNVSGELDHLISLELGGSNDLSNLWVEAGPIPNPKDSVENALHKAVCDGRITLVQAQNAISTDWETALKMLGLN